jgi:Rrf2 family cysteine metabolism transcriptional repressor
MQLSKGFDYAVRSLVFLAMMPPGTSAELKAISSSQNVPVSYLAKVMRHLVRGGLVSSTLGREGGYALRRAPEEITLLQVYQVMEGEMKLVQCMEDERNCSFFSGCAQASVWRRLKDTVEQIFRETTLRDLLPKAVPFATLPKTTKERKYERPRA